MLRMVMPSGQYWDEKNQEFVYPEGKTILLEHSLLSLSKWESRWKKPILSKEQKTKAETVDYVRCMTLTPDVGREFYDSLSQSNINMINQYINDPMTATTFYDSGKIQRPSREIVTAELIYYWMVALQIPFECQNWHLNKLLTLIRVCNIKNQPKKKMSSHEIMSRNAKLNAERRAKTGSKG